MPSESASLVTHRRRRQREPQSRPWYSGVPAWVWRIIALLLVLHTVLLALGAWGWGHISRLHLPVPPGLSVLAVFLPIINFLGISQGLLASRGTLEKLQTFRVNFYTIVTLVLDAVLVTLAATHLPDANLNCTLERSWSYMFSHKDAKHINYIQEALNCCGFRKPKHMAYPFPSKGSNSTCEAIKHRKLPCLVPWKKTEQTSVGLYLTVGLVLGLVKVLSLIYINRSELIRGEDAPAEPQTEARVEELVSDSEVQVGRSNGNSRMAIESGSPDERTHLLDDETRQAV